MTSFAHLDQWVIGINNDLYQWLFRQVNERLKRSGSIHVNQQRLENDTIKEYPLGSPEFGRQRLAAQLSNPDCSPFAGYTVLVHFLETSSRTLDKRHRTAPVFVSKDGKIKWGESNLQAEAWECMEQEGKKTFNSNRKFKKLLDELSSNWEESNWLYDKGVLSRLSFVPTRAIQWCLKMRKRLQRSRRFRKPLIQRYSNPKTNLKNDNMLSDDHRDLPQQEELRILAQDFRLFSKERERQIFDAIGIDKRTDDHLKQAIWSQILPPLFSYVNRWATARYK